MKKTNERKKLRKVKKRWVVVAISMVSGMLIPTAAQALRSRVVLDLNALRNGDIFRAISLQPEGGGGSSGSGPSTSDSPLTEAAAIFAGQVNALNNDASAPHDDEDPTPPPLGGGEDSSTILGSSPIQSLSAAALPANPIETLRPSQTFDSAQLTDANDEQLAEKEVPKSIEQSKTDLSKLSKEEQELQQLLKKEKSEVGNLEQQKTALQSIVGELEEWIEEHNEDVEFLDESINDYEDELVKINDQLADGKDLESNPLTEDAIKKLENRKAKLEKRIQKNKEKKNKVIKKISDRQIILEERRKKLSDLEQELIEKRKKIAELDEKSKVLSSGAKTSSDSVVDDKKVKEIADQTQTKVVSQADFDLAVQNATLTKNESFLTSLNLIGEGQFSTLSLLAELSRKVDSYEAVLTSENKSDVIEAVSGVQGNTETKAQKLERIKKEGEEKVRVGKLAKERSATGGKFLMLEVLPLAEFPSTREKDIFDYYNFILNKNVESRTKIDILFLVSKESRRHILDSEK
ncbi:MAG: KxYKxGKxW signal peptide domain-containing protein, partial [Lactobacillales bacterium]|nr:KxYKxGKxW signal peptide domain-containing protein [Lactobacillales bacterium]